MRKSKEQWWIECKLRSGVSREQLLHTVGCFSNKKKERVMKEKGLNEKQYRDRYEFLSNVYTLLSSSPAPRSQPAPRSGYLRDRTPPPDLTPAQKKRVEELMRPEPRSTPVYDYSKYFDFDDRGRIKGSYTPDGRFEPD